MTRRAPARRVNYSTTAYLTHIRPQLIGDLGCKKLAFQYILCIRFVSNYFFILENYLLKLSVSSRGPDEEYFDVSAWSTCLTKNRKKLIFLDFKFESRKMTGRLQRSSWHIAGRFVTLENDS